MYLSTLIYTCIQSVSKYWMASVATFVFSSHKLVQCGRKRTDPVSWKPLTPGWGDCFGSVCPTFCGTIQKGGKWLEGMALVPPQLSGFFFSKLQLDWYHGYSPLHWEPQTAGFE